MIVLIKTDSIIHIYGKEIEIHNRISLLQTINLDHMTAINISTKSTKAPLIFDSYDYTNTKARK